MFPTQHYSKTGKKEDSIPNIHIQVSNRLFMPPVYTRNDQNNNKFKKEKADFLTIARMLSYR